MSWIAEAVLMLVGRLLVAAVACVVSLAAGLALLGILGEVLLNSAGPIGDTALGGRLIVVAIVGTLLAAGLHFATRDGPSDQAARIGLALGGGMSISALALVVLLLVTTGIGSALGHRGEIAGSLADAIVTIDIAAAVAAIVTVAIVSLLLHFAVDVTLPAWATTALVVMAVLIATGGAARLLMVGDPPAAGESGSARILAIGARPHPRNDVVLLVNPRSTPGRRLVRMKGARLREARTDAVLWDTAYGLARIDPRAPHGWRPVQAPVCDPAGAGAGLARQPPCGRGELVAALRSLSHARGSRADVSYGPALVSLMRRRAMPWRRGSRRAVVLIVRTLPTARQLRIARMRPVAGDRRPDAIRRIVPRHHPEEAVSARHGVALVVIADRASSAAAARWRRWTRATGGGLVVHRTLSADREHVARHKRRLPTIEAEDAILPREPSLEHRLALRHRPHLLFDEGQELRAPIDVDSFLAERGDDGRPAHQVCRQAWPAYVDCHDVASARDLRPDAVAADLVLHIDANPAKPPATELDRTGIVGARSAGRGKAMPRIYYHATWQRDGPRALHLDYWVFYRFNDGPAFGTFTCVSGFAVTDRTCFDHEGDWEGITVTLVDEGDGLRPRTAVYATHERRFRFDWPALEQADATDGPHPRVWVAAGSHASYPDACRQKRCHQIRSDIPDGSRDGHLAWDYNDDAVCARVHCLLPLPVTRGGAPASWNAFPGKWGLPRCTLGTLLCARSLGPGAPSTQTRYRRPGCGRDADEVLARPGEEPLPAAQARSEALTQVLTLACARP